MRKKLNLLFGLVLIISMIALIGCGGSGKTGEKNPYEGKWVAVSAQMMGMSVSIDETFGGAFEFEVKNNGKVSFSVGDTTGNGKWSVEDNQFILSIEGEGTKIVVYDYDGNQLLKLGGEDISSPDKLGSITGMAETENGFVAADGNMREIQFWAKDGTHVGAISTEDIFGVSYPWLEDMQLLDDGSLLIMLTQERDDGSANELMFFRLTGF